MRKVNDRTIHRKKYYPWFYHPKTLKLNLVPVSFYTLYQARFTLEHQFGKKCWETLNIVKGSVAIRNGWELGKNSFWVDGRRRQVKKRYIPPEYAFSKSRRRTYVKRIKDHTGHGKPSLINNMLKKQFIKTYATR